MPGVPSRVGWHMLWEIIPRGSHSRAVQASESDQGAEGPLAAIIKSAVLVYCFPGHTRALARPDDEIKMETRRLARCISNPGSTNTNCHVYGISLRRVPLGS